MGAHAALAGNPNSLCWHLAPCQLSHAACISERYCMLEAPMLVALETHQLVGIWANAVAWILAAYAPLSHSAAGEHAKQLLGLYLCADKAALLSAKKSLDPTGEALSSWTSETCPCLNDSQTLASSAWEGVTCSVDGVTSL
jgi:hypothetical protein